MLSNEIVGWVKSEKKLENVVHATEKIHRDLAELF